ncbi:MAG TPA: CPBP family intramembrane glutamic endopeptidase [Gemmatimonadaceae bacterium]
MTDRYKELRFTPLVLWPLGGAVIALLLSRVPPRADRGEMLIAVSYIVYGLLFLAATRACAKAGVRVSEVFGRPPTNPAPWFHALIVVPFLLMTAGLLVVVWLIIGARFAPQWTNALLSKPGIPDLLQPAASFTRWQLALIAVAVAPIVEEFVFRGLVLRRFVATRGFWQGVLVSAAIFALLHPQQLLGAFVAGIVLALLYLASGSLLVSMLAHALNNAAVTVGILYARPDAQDARPETMVTMLRADWAPISIAVLVALLAVGGCLIWLIRPLVAQARERALHSYLEA